MTSIFLAQTASFVKPPSVDTVFQNGLKADWDVTITLQTNLNDLLKDYRLEIPVANHGNSVDVGGDGEIKQTSTPAPNIQDAQTQINIFKASCKELPSLMYDKSYVHAKDNANKTTLIDNVTVALIALFTNGVVGFGDKRDAAILPRRKTDGKIDISLLLPKGCSVIDGSLNEWLTSSSSADTSWYKQVLVHQQMTEILADAVLFQRFKIYGQKANESAKELMYVDLNDAATDSTINPRPTADGGAFYAILVDSSGNYILDANNKQQGDITGPPYTPTEMYGKLNLVERDRMAVIVNLGYVLRDGRDLQIRLCLEQCNTPTAGQYSTQYDTKDPITTQTWTTSSNVDYAANQAELFTLPDPSIIQTASIAALQAYVYSYNYVNFCVSGVSPNRIVYASRINLPSYVAAQNVTMYSLPPPPPVTTILNLTTMTPAEVKNVIPDEAVPVPSPMAMYNGWKFSNTQLTATKGTKINWYMNVAPVITKVSPAKYTTADLTYQQKSIFAVSNLRCAYIRLQFHVAPTANTVPFLVQYTLLEPGDNQQNSQWYHSRKFSNVYTGSISANKDYILYVGSDPRTCGFVAPAPDTEYIEFKKGEPFTQPIQTIPTQTDFAPTDVLRFMAWSTDSGNTLTGSTDFTCAEMGYAMGPDTYRFPTVF